MQLDEGILASIPASVLLLDRRLCVISANRNFLEKSRRSPESTIGQPLASVFPPALLSYTRLEDRTRRVFTTGQMEDGGEMTYRTAGLPTRYYFYRLTPIWAENGRQVEYVMLLMEDITERVRLGEEIRRAERHLASVVDSAKDLVVSMDPDGTIKTWNRTAEQLSGYDESEVQGQSLLSFCQPDDRDTMRTLLRKVRLERDSANAESDIVTKSAAVVPIAWSVSAMCDDMEAVIGLVAIGRDLTERRQLEAQLVQSAKMASLGVMAGGIAHEIRNPLGICLAAAQLMQEHPDDLLLLQQATEKIFAAAQRASNIIESLLKFARPSQSHMASLNLHDLIDETLDLLTNQTTVRLIKVEKQLFCPRPVVIGNRSLLQQVFTNLILNAINAMAEGGELCIATRDNLDQVQIVFGDTGKGIVPEHLHSIFDPFFTTMPVGQGAGLGLSISYSIVKQHKGQITVESQIGQGSKFTVWLPYAREEQHGSTGIGAGRR